MKKVEATVTESSAGMRLDAFVLEAITSGLGRMLSKAKVRKLILAGAVFVNGRQAGSPAQPLRAGARLRIQIDESLLDTDAPATSDRAWTMGPDAILYEDEFLIAVNKPPGLPTQPTLDKARPNLFDGLKAFLSQREGKEAYVGLHHRLDRDTSGVVLFTKKKEANLGVSELFKNHQIQKTYVAVAVPSGRGGPLSDRLTVRNFLKKDSLKKGKMREVRAGGDLAITHFVVLDRGAGAVLVQAQPQTGRMHQIRVHLAGLGWPIFGDATYGRPASGSRLALHAAVLTFKHPISSLELKVRAPIPPDFHTCLKETDLSLPLADLPRS